MSNLNSYLNVKMIKGDQLFSYFIMLILCGLLIGGGVIIIQDEGIFNTIYEGFQTEAKASKSNAWVNLPTGLSLQSLQKNVGVLRDQSNLNLWTGYGMIATGSIIALYQTYSLFF